MEPGIGGNGMMAICVIAFRALFGSISKWFVSEHRVMKTCLTACHPLLCPIVVFEVVLRTHTFVQVFNAFASTRPLCVQD